MARQTLVLDASVGVKWFSAEDEPSLSQALAIRDGHVAGQVHVLVPDLFHYEVAAALVHKSSVPADEVERAIGSLFALGLETVATSVNLMAVSVKLARRLNITVYDACYAALARQQDCPLVTANPRHQSGALSCEVIPLNEWR